MIHWELCKKLSFDLTTKWYILKQESFSENETREILWEFYIQTDQLIPVERSDIVLIKKKRYIYIYI